MATKGLSYKLRIKQRDQGGEGPREGQGCSHLAWDGSALQWSLKLLHSDNTMKLMIIVK